MKRYFFWRDKRLQEITISFFKRLYITLGILLVMFAFYHIGNKLYLSVLAGRTTNALTTGLAHDTAYLQQQGDLIAKNPSLIADLLANNTANISVVITQEQASRSIGAVVVTDASGAVISRTDTPTDVGNNIFLSTPIGRVTAQGKSVQSIESSTLHPNQILMITGRPVNQGGRMIGTVNTDSYLDDQYAVRLRNTYLPQGTEVMFYTKGYGLYGDSFSDHATRTLLESYFNTQSDWIKNGDSGKTVSFPDGSYYLVQNVVFPGLESSPGGVLIFIPQNDLTLPVDLVIALITVLVFVFLTLRDHVRLGSFKVHWRYYVSLCTTALVLFGLVYGGLIAQRIGFLRLSSISYPLYNSTLRFEPEWGVYNLGYERRFTVMVNTGDETINAVSIVFHFDPQALDVRELDVASSTCDYFIENTVDNKNGVARLSCVILNGTAGKNSLPIADVVASPLRSGTANLTFDDTQSQVSASDGLGTNVLRTSEGASYRFIAATSSANTLVVFSPSHPNQSRWYNLPTARFAWLDAPGAVYAYSLDTFATSTPSRAHTTMGTSVEVPIPGDGVYYFHVASVSGGPVAHYSIQADMTPPTIISMTPSASNIVEGDVVRFSFQAQDMQSGVEQNYYIDLGGHLFLPVGSQVFVPFLEAGDQTVTLRVYDNAGNYAEKSQVVHVGAK